MQLKKGVVCKSMQNGTVNKVFDPIINLGFDNLRFYLTNAFIAITPMHNFLLEVIKNIFRQVTVDINKYQFIYI